MPWNDAGQRKAYYARVLKKLPGEVRGDNHGNLLNRLALMSQADVARKLGMTRQAVHQTERRALSRLRVALEPMWRELRA